MAVADDAPHASTNPHNFPEIARKHVYDHVAKNLEKTDLHVKFSPDDVYVVWFCYTLGNWKAMISTSLANNQYYEVTCNHDKGELYIDTYVKINNNALPIVMV